MEMLIAGAIAGLAGNIIGRSQGTTIPSEDPHLKGLKNKVYDNSGWMNDQSKEIFNNLKELSQKQIQNPADFMKSLYNQYTATAGETMGINNQLASMKNQLMAQGIDPNSQEGIQQLNMAQNQLLNANRQQWLSNVGNSYTQGLQAQSDLMHTGQQAGFEMVSGIQRDRQQQLAEAQEENAQIQQNIANNPLTKMGDTMMGAGTQATIYQQYPQLYSGNNMWQNQMGNPYSQAPSYQNPYQMQQMQQMQQARNLGFIN